jgi:hypothetical protein
VVGAGFCDFKTGDFEMIREQMRPISRWEPVAEVGDWAERGREQSRSPQIDRTQLHLWSIISHKLSYLLTTESISVGFDRRKGSSATL